MSFQFVDHSDINRGTRKLIRSHVMKGKNSGKIRTKRDKRSETTNNKSIVAFKTESTLRGKGCYDPITVLGHQQDSNILLSVTRQVTNDINLVSPARVTSQAIRHLQQMCRMIIEIVSPNIYCQPTGVFGWMWFQLLFEDEAYFHCNVGMASACTAFLTDDTRNHSPMALYHMSQAYRLVSGRLSTPGTLSDTTIAVVTIISIYDRLYGDPQKAMVHLDGVARMIHLRGGMLALAERQFLIAEKALRTDIELAINCNQTPKFSSHDVPSHLILIEPRDRDSSPKPRKWEPAINSILYRTVQRCAELQSISLDALRFARILDDASRGDTKKKLDPAAYQATLIYLTYRLIEIPPPSPPFSDIRSSRSRELELEDLAQLAILGFLNTFSFGLGHKIMTFPTLTKRFRVAARKDVVFEEGEEENSGSSSSRDQKMFVFWALIMGRISSLVSGVDGDKDGDSRDGDGNGWFMRKLAALADDLGFRVWADARAALGDGDFPWVGASNDAPGEKLWNAMRCFARPAES